METIQTHARYVEWLSADEMHNHSKEWLSQLEFIRDEHLFFEDLIKSNTLQLINPEKFAHNKEIIDAINRSQKHNNLLIEAIQTHENELKILVDGINQPKEEEAYKKEHRGLIVKISEFLKYYRTLKVQLFDIVKAIKKEEKIRLLIDGK
ncbi:hypothetical protein HNV10_15400 [Winogradskyella litoriviva]|uniref:Hemerythrin HHE cation binding domain-containing protein n=1 Tax=Winogradskyella litoriviva TaxID=1220182 RepID=A0ABX2E8H5_9FLAO|nr:hypothetical protein [Winogradskyella litoriviva]NRD24639.1 hypothetical protein [Winogradskyella litoriviva]